MANIKDPARIAEKFARVTPSRTPDYEQGVENPRADWKEQTKAAQESWRQGMQQAMSRGSWEKGVDRAGTETWRENTLRKGPGRWAEGVAMSQEKYREGFAPYAETIRNLKLPERGPVGDPRNLQRVSAVAKALHERKIQLRGTR